MAKGGPGALSGWEFGVCLIHLLFSFLLLGRDMGRNGTWVATGHAIQPGMGLGVWDILLLQLRDCEKGLELHWDERNIGMGEGPC